MDGVLENNEECDDGNHYNLDGCSTQCVLENPGMWLCNTSLDMRTECCARLVNPVTELEVCSCAEVEQPSEREGFTITKACLKRDIDECNTDNGNCLVTATCRNIDVVKNADPHKYPLTHMCECPPNTIGDGITICL
jgi:cysteine-rich repeat protein